MRLALCFALLFPVVVRSAEPEWVAPMKKVHARFTGTPGTLACYGDSITISMAFWAPLRHAPKDAVKELTEALVVIKGHMKEECWAGWKGPRFGNNGSMTIRWAHENIDAWLKEHNPEAAVIMFGTNDLSAVPLKDYAVKTGEVIDQCLKNGTVPILTTPPPRSGLLTKSQDYAEMVRAVARGRKVPLIDYHAEVLKRRPDDWDGSLPPFKDTKGGEYEVPTLISGDGVHPSNPKAHQDYSDASLSRNGFALRNYLTARTYADVVRRVLKGKPRP